MICDAVGNLPGVRLPDSAVVDRSLVQFHHHGYVSGDPRISPPAGTGVERPSDLPAEVDVLIVGAGPAGMLLAAQLSQFPSITTRLVDRRLGRLERGQADGIQARSVETFQAFGFAEKITQEAYRITAMNFWGPDPADPGSIVRTSRTKDDELGVSEFPHLIVNQARVLDCFAEVMVSSPTRMTPDWGYDFEALQIDVDAGSDHPVEVVLRRTGDDDRSTRTVRARYVVGCDGARSGVRQAIGRTLTGDQAFHAWAVMDVLAVTDFPDIRTKCAIQSSSGSILLIPREGGYLFRMYVDLGSVPATESGTVRTTTVETAITRANEILHPYVLDVRDVAWYSVYEVGHRLTDRFDDVEPGDERAPRVFIAGDACHTHSAKAGQGMNVSMQDGFNLGWKLGHVLEGRSPESLLSTYSAERQVIAQNLIDFDREWSSRMAASATVDDATELGEFYVRTSEFPAGFMTQYPESLVVGNQDGQRLAVGYPVGKRFRSAPVVRVADANPVHLGHHARADGRWRLYAFADAGEALALAAWAEWLATASDSPLLSCTSAGSDVDSLFDVKVIYQRPHFGVDISAVPHIFLPRSGPFQLVDYEKVYAVDPDDDIFAARQIDRDSGCVVVVRPDQYVAAVVGLGSTGELTRFFDGLLIPAQSPWTP